MSAITLRRDGTPLDDKKPFAWSYSKLKNFEICPRRHLETDLLKSVEEEQSHHLVWGDRVHKTAADHLSKGEPLPSDVENILAPWMARILKDDSAIRKVECNYALTRHLEPCGYFDKDVWFRIKIDVLKISEDVALAIDWKTGKIQADSVQLALTAATVFAHHPEIQNIRTEYIWLAEDATTREDFSREDMPLIWLKLFPRVEQLEKSYDTGIYLETPNRMCASYCRVEACQHHGKRYNGSRKN